MIAAAAAAIAVAARVPDVRGMNAPDAVALVVKSGLCVKLVLGARVPPGGKVPVLRQSPAGGAVRDAWSPVTLTIAVPAPPSLPKNAHVTLSVSGWVPAHTPCPPIRVSG